MSEASDRESLRSIFLMEAWDTVVALEAAGGAGDEIFLLTHRLKGAASLHGFPAIAALADEMERLATPPSTEAAVAPPPRRFETLVAALKAALETLDADAKPVASRTSTPPDPADPVREELERFVLADTDVLSYFAPEAAEHLDAMGASLLALGQGAGPDEVARLFRAVHTLKGAAYVVGCAAVGRIAHCMEDLLVAVRDGGHAPTAAAVDALFAGADLIRAMLATPLDPATNFTTAADGLLARLGALAGGDAAPASREAPRETQPAPAPVLPPVRLAPFVPAKAPASRPAPARTAPDRQTVRVSLERLDSLMDLVGELVVARSRLDGRLAELDRVADTLVGSRARLTATVGDFERRSLGGVAAVGSWSREPVPASALSVSAMFAELEFDRYDDATLLARRVGEIAADVADAQAELAVLTRAVRDDLGHVQRLTLAIRAEIGRARLVPIGGLFTRFVRQAQEAARAAGKNVRVETSGESVEIDTSLMEQIVDPLLHLVQNAVTHGIESEEERAAAGKRVPATLRLTARQQGGSVLVEVVDDGRGIDPALIRRRAVERGILDAVAAAALSDETAVQLIFQPGFSTAVSVTAAAGRGVGMDVVRTNVRRMNGDVEVLSTPGQGARVLLRLPLTVLVSEVLLVRVGNEILAAPVNAVHSVLAAAAGDARATPSGATVEVDGMPVRVLPLAAALGLRNAPRGARRPAVVVRTPGEILAVEVDEVMHREDVVIKPLGAFLQGVGPWCGASIDAEGRARLVLDPAGLSGLTGVPAPAADTPSHAAATSRRRCVLLVDDSPSVRRFVGSMLGRAGFDVTTAVDGADAISRLADVAFDVIVTDLEMPRVNGYELIESVRRRRGATPIVVLTTRAGDKHASLARQLGVEHYVTKPVDEESFLRLVATLAEAA